VAYFDHNVGDLVVKDSPWVDVRAHGAVGDGTTDDTASIQAAIDAASAGSTILFPTPSSDYKITSAITVDKALTLLGYDSQITQATSDTTGISITASNVRVVGLKVVGPQYALSKSNEHGILAVGTSAASPITGLIIRDTDISNWGMSAVNLQFANDFEITNNKFYDLYYAGVITYSTIRGNVSLNNIRNVVGTPLAYGITLTRVEDDSIVTYPRSENITVVGNVIRDVTNWEGIDTHGGKKITISGNTILGCNRGIAVGPADNGSQVETFAPFDVTVSGNVIDSEVSDGTAGFGISFTGAVGVLGTPQEKATGAITGNTCRGHGDEDNDISGSFYIRTTEGLSVTGNSLIEPSPYGINFYYDNYDFVCSGNSIVDPWSDSVTIPSGIISRSSYNTGHIGGNSIGTDAKSATYVAVNAVRMTPSQTGVDISIGVNYSEATNLLVDSDGDTDTEFQKFTVGSTGTQISYLLWNAEASVADGGNIAHGMGTTPTAAFVMATTSGEFASVAGINGTNITVNIKKHDNSAGTTQTIYWVALR
jgi:hypothetical protein